MGKLDGNFFLGHIKMTYRYFVEQTIETSPIKANQNTLILELPVYCAKGDLHG